MTNKELDPHLQENLDSIEHPADMSSLDQKSGQPGQIVREIIRDSIIVPLVRSGEIKPGKPDADE